MSYYDCLINQLKVFVILISVVIIHFLLGLWSDIA
jgi:hypothetical protein